MCTALAHVRFTPNSDGESGFPQTVMSALPPKQTCAVQQLMSALGQKRTCAAKQLMSATGRVQTQSDGSVLCCSRQVLGIGRPSGFGVKQVANANS